MSITSVLIEDRESPVFAKEVGSIAVINHVHLGLIDFTVTSIDSA